MGRWSAVLVVCGALLVSELGIAGTQTGGGDPGADSQLTSLANTPSANLFTGALSTGVTIQVPPGRPNLTPLLSLSYSSAGGMGPYGMGWQLPLGSISRSTKFGVPLCHAWDNGPGYDDGDRRDEYILDIGGELNEIVAEPGGDGLYRPRVDASYAEAEPDETARTWVVRARNGLRYTFGETAESRMYRGSDVWMVGPPTCDFISVWYLTRIEDANGNTIEISYVKHGNISFPEEILYGGNNVGGPNGIDHAFRVGFTLEPIAPGRPKIRTLSRGIDEELSHRIARIDVEYREDGGGTPFEQVRSYELGYDEMPRSGHFLLADVAHGVDNVNGSGELYPLEIQTYSYSQPDMHYVPGVAWDVPVGLAEPAALRKSVSGDSEHTLLDVNADGFVDWVRHDPAFGGTDEIYFGNGAGFDATPLSGSFDEFLHAVDLGSETKTVREAVDIDGDGFIDSVAEAASGWTVRTSRCGQDIDGMGFAACFFSAAEAWSAPVVWTKLSDGLRGAERHGLRDMNGDGRPDLVTFEDPEEFKPMEIHYNTGAGIAPAVSLAFEPGIGVSLQMSSTDMRTRRDIIDVNGDGLPDHVRVEDLDTRIEKPSTGFEILKVYNHDPNPAIFAAPISEGDQPITLTDYFTAYQPFVDVNGSGIEYIRNGTPGHLVGAIVVRLNNGYGFGDGIVSPNVNEVVRADEVTHSRVGFVDVNADGLPDWVAVDESVSPHVWRVAYNKGDGTFWADAEVKPGAPASGYEGTIRSTEIVQGAEGFLRFGTGSSNNNTTHQEIFDWDGDGLPDQVAADAGTRKWTPRLLRSMDPVLPHLKPYLLVRSDHSWGATTEYQYEPSTNFDHGEQLSVVSWLVTGIRERDGLCDTPATDWFTHSGNPCLALGHELVRQIAYEGGMFDGPTREFRGFRMVSVTDGAGSRRDVTHYQGHALRGQVEVEEVWAGGAELVSRRTMDWRTIPSGIEDDDEPPAGRVQVYLREQREDDFAAFAQYGGADRCLLHRTDAPDAFGRQSLACSLPCDGAPPLDSGAFCSPVAGQKTVHTEWADPQMAAPFPVWERPSRLWNEYHDGITNERASESRFFYDQLTSAETTKGHLWREDRFHGTGVNDFIRMEYTRDSGPGNIIAIENVTQGNGPSTIRFGRLPEDSDVYGDVFQLFPTEETPPSLGAGAPLGRTKRKHDLRFGLPIRVATEVGEDAGEPVYDITEAWYNPWGWIHCESRPPVAPTGCGLPGTYTIRAYSYDTGTAGAPKLIDRTQKVTVNHYEPFSSSEWVSSAAWRDQLGRERMAGSIQFVVDAEDPLVAPSEKVVITQHVAYDSAGNVSREYSPYVWHSPFEYEASPTSGFTDYDYTLNGNVSGYQDPAGRPFRVTAPSLTTVETLYEGDRVRTIRDGDHREVRVDHFGRAIARIAYDGPTTEVQDFAYELDGRDNIVRSVATEPVSGETATEDFEFDLLGRLIGRSDENSTRTGGGHDWVYRYDALDNQIYIDDPDAGEIQSCYDAWGRLTMRGETAQEVGIFDDDFCTDPQATTYSYSYTYDDVSFGNRGVGRLTRATGPHFISDYRYDQRGRVIAQTSTIDGIPATQLFEYDDADHLLNVTYPDGEIVDYSYNETGQATGIKKRDTASVVGTTYVSDVWYDHFGRTVWIERGHGVTDSFAFHDASENFRLREIKVEHPSTPADSMRMHLEFPAYDAFERIEEVIDHFSPAGERSLSATFQYDAIGRLEQKAYSGGLPSENFTYDGLGRMKTMNGDSFHYEAAAPHHLTAVRDSSAQDILTFAYNDNGSRDSKVRVPAASGRQQNYAYDPFGRMASVSILPLGGGGGPSDLVEFAYDHQGRRVRREASVDGVVRRFFSRYAESEPGLLLKYYFLGDVRIATRTESTTDFSELPPGATPIQFPPELYIGLALLLVGLLARPVGAQRQTAGVVVARGRAASMASLIVTIWLPLTMTVACGGQTTVRHYHVDQRGSAVLLTQGGDTAVEYRYSAYGELVGVFDGQGAPIAPDPESRYEFDGYYSDRDTDLQYAGARYYDPEIAQFNRHDPEKAHFNPYTYADWDPVNKVDPDGRFWALIGFVVGVIAAVAQAIQAGAQQGGGAALRALIIGTGTAALGYGVGAGFVQGSFAQLAQVIGGTATQALQYTVAAASVGYGGYGFVGAVASGDAATAIGIGLGLVVAVAAIGSSLSSDDGGDAVRPASQGESESQGLFVGGRDAAPGDRTRFLPREVEVPKGETRQFAVSDVLSADLEISTNRRSTVSVRVSEVNAGPDGNLVEPVLDKNLKSITRKAPFTASFGPSKGETSGFIVSVRNHAGDPATVRLESHIRISEKLIASR